MFVRRQEQTCQLTLIFFPFGYEWKKDEGNYQHILEN